VLSLVPTSLGKKGGKRAALLSNIAQRVPWQGIRRLYDPQAELVLWLHHRYPHSLATWTLRGDTVLKDFALINAVVERELPFRLVTGPEIGTVVNSRIVYSVDAYNPARVRNYSASLMAALRQLEAQGNVLYPSADEAEWWENKVFMHRRFDELGINTPPTTIVGRETDVDEESLEYPLIAKEPHSHGSLGVHKVGDAGELRALRGRLAADGFYDLLLQRMLDIRRDMRCTLIGGAVVHHYFRVRHSEEWAPTSTRHGSTVDFGSFPERWRGRILDAFAKTGLRSGAFDICWDGDDLDSEPYFLEISPAYTPNPAPPPAFADRPYAEFKTQLTGPDSYPSAFVDLVFELQRKVVDSWCLG
jgi:glutathione synthase/RimK-type ligase-like ATP-grasp enzyme